MGDWVARHLKTRKSVLRPTMDIVIGYPLNRESVTILEVGMGVGRFVDLPSLLVYADVQGHFPPKVRWPTG